MYFDVEANNLGIDPIFTIDGRFIFQINTRKTHSFTAITGDVLPAAGNSGLFFLIQIQDLTLDVLGGALKFTGSGLIRIQNGHLRVEISDLSFNFFGLATIHASGWFQDDGQFFLHVTGALNLGAAGTGIFGYVDVTIGRQNEVGFPDPVLYVDGEISGSIKLAGITLAGVTVGINFDGITGRLSARVTVHLLFFSVSKTFTIGYLAVPPPVFLASLASEFNTQTGQVINPNLGDARANIAARHLWDNTDLTKDGDGTLYLNIGNRADLRSVNGIPAGEPYRNDEDEYFIIEHIDDVPLDGQTPLPNGSETIKVTALGRTQTFRGVKKIVALDAGQGDDIIVVKDGVTSQLDLHGGADNDTIVALGTGGGAGAQSVLDGGSGDDESSPRAR